jgi:hypothetical protein
VTNIARNLIKQEFKFLFCAEHFAGIFFCAIELAEVGWNQSRNDFFLPVKLFFVLKANTCQIFT